MAPTTWIRAGRTRIAPTPSGLLHAGNAFNFLLTERLAKASNSKLVLRIDDLDAERRRPEYIEDIFRSLEWLGIRIDEGPSGPEDFLRNWSQERRIPRYEAVAEVLRKLGAMYRCTCSRSQLEAMDVDGTEHPCRTIGLGCTAVSASWRLRIDAPCPVHVLLVSGPSEPLDLTSLLHDPVLLQRNSGRPAYQLASLCDDVDMGITFIVRGSDLLPSTACQLHLADLLGLEAFSRVRFQHHPVMVGANGQKLSKSAGASSLQAMRSAGHGPEAIVRSVDRYVEEMEKGLSA